MRFLCSSLLVCGRDDLLSRYSRIQISSCAGRARPPRAASPPSALFDRLVLFLLRSLSLAPSPLHRFLYPSFRCTRLIHLLSPRNCHGHLILSVLPQCNRGTTDSGERTRRFPGLIIQPRQTERLIIMSRRFFLSYAFTPRRGYSAMRCVHVDITLITL